MGKKKNKVVKLSEKTFGGVNLPPKVPYKGGASDQETLDSNGVFPMDRIPTKDQ